MKHIRTIIVDDEPAARARPLRLIAQDPEMALVAECRNDMEALDAVQEHRPDLIFLDVQMPQMNGIETLDRIANERKPLVILVTADDQYALKAFDRNAVDYLLKPYDDDRFFSSLEKAKKHIDMRMNSKPTGKLLDLMPEHMHAKSEYTEVFTIREKGREYKAIVDDIVLLQAEGNYLCLRMKDRNHLYRMTMNSVGYELDPSRFLRIHRSFIVNTAHIRNTRYSGNNEFIFTMANGELIVSGRSYKEQIAKALQERSV